MKIPDHAFAAKPAKTLLSFPAVTRSPKSMRRLVMLSAMLSIAGYLYAGDRYWEKKDYRQWTMKECEQLLVKSPWSHTQPAIVDVVIQAIRQGDAAPASRTGVNMNASQTTITPDETSSGRASSNQINYVVQFRSADPIRKAVVRSALIN